MEKKRVSPHTIRRSTACHLLRAGADINTIRGWLGHVSLDTTNDYAEIDLEMKANALAMCEIGDGKSTKRWHEPKLMSFLRTIWSSSHVAFGSIESLMRQGHPAWTPHNFQRHITSPVLTLVKPLGRLPGRSEA